MNAREEWIIYYRFCRRVVKRPFNHVRVQGTDPLGFSQLLLADKILFNMINLPGSFRERSDINEFIFRINKSRKIRLLSQVKLP